MQVKELKQDGLSYELEVVLGAKDIDAYIDAQLLEVGKTARLPGFRPGKVPLALLKQRYGRAVLSDVLERAVNDSSAKAIEQHKLRPALQPKIEVKEFDEGKDLKYVMAVEVLPEFTVMDLKGIKVEKPIVPVDKKAVDEALERIAKNNAETKPIASARATKTGDIVIIDYKGRTKKDDKEHPGMAATDARLELGSGQFIAGFEDQLTGKKVGDKVAVNVTFPDPYHSDELAGQPAIFDVEIKEIHERAAVEINDEFAKKLGLDSEKALRDLIEKQIGNEYGQVSRLKLKRALLDVLDDGHEFPVPQGMLDMEFGSILQQIKAERQAAGGAEAAKLEDGEEDELKAIAGRRVRLGMILSEIGRANNIRITDQELQRAVIAEAQKYPGQEAQVFEFFRKNRQALDSLKAPVFEDKVVDFILELATVTEKNVTLDELTAEDDVSYTDSKKGKSSSAKKTKKETSEDTEKPKKAAKK